jgi:hypothetical protein
VRLIANPNNIPLDVHITICTDCGYWGEKDLESCGAAGHHTSTVHYDLSAEQNDSVAMQRVADLQKHGRRLLADA